MDRLRNTFAAAQQQPSQRLFLRRPLALSCVSGVLGHSWSMPPYCMYARVAIDSAALIGRKDPCAIWRLELSPCVCPPLSLCRSVHSRKIQNTRHVSGPVPWSMWPVHPTNQAGKRSTQKLPSLPEALTSSEITLAAVPHRVVGLKNDARVDLISIPMGMRHEPRVAKTSWTTSSQLGTLGRYLSRPGLPLSVDTTWGLHISYCHVRRTPQIWHVRYAPPR